MYGAYIGDVIGSTYEYKKMKRLDFELFPEGSSYTDDSIMTAAVAEALMLWDAEGGDLKSLFVKTMQKYGRRYPHPVGAYGLRFAKWLRKHDPKPYYSCGNGSAMRASPCGLAARSLEEALDLAEQSAVVTHDHPEGVKGAQATAAAVYLAKSGADRDEIGAYIREHFYPLDRRLEEIRPGYTFKGNCQESVPESIQAFLESDSFESAIRNVISLGGDADTMGAITGAIAWAYYGRNGITPEMTAIWEQARQRIHEPLAACADAFRDFCEKRCAEKV